MLKIDNLKKSYGDFQLELSMKVEAGQVTGLLGRNGTGKSTTIKAILGLIHPDQGQVTLFGQPVDQLNAIDKEKIGVVLTDSNFSRIFTCEDVIGLLDKSYSKFDKEMFRQFINQHKIDWKKKFEDFSTGMLAKIKLITAISHRAQFLIMDEPTAGLDVVAREELLDLLRTYLEEYPETSILISSHIASDLEDLCDDFYLIHDGKLVLHEEMDRLLSAYGVIKIRQDDFDKLDQQYLLEIRPESYGFRCLTYERQFYLDNYPNLIVEKASVDELIKLMAGDKK